MTMKITDIRLAELKIPLRTPFRTAVRSVDHVEDIIVEIHTDEGAIGYGEAPPTGRVTGDTKGAIVGAMRDHLIPALMGRSVEDFNELLDLTQGAIQHNTSAKAAMEIALYDLFGQMLNAPVYRLLGGSGAPITTDITISVNEPDEMVRDSLNAVSRGYKTLKIKVGNDAAKDMARMKAIRAAIGNEVALRIDANQGWKPKEAVRLLNEMEDAGLQIEFVEQPVHQADVEGLRYVREHVAIPVMADEAVYSPRDVAVLIQQNACDLINIKLMKTGGIKNALAICALAETYGVECMIGCMLEAKVSVNAAVHLASAKNRVITKVDLDGPVLCATDPIEGGAIFNEALISLPDTPGFGIKHITGLRYLS